jgi:uncharacterized protein (TIGR03435 family)
MKALELLLNFLLNQALLNQVWVARAGWTLLHFLWQGTLIALLFAVVRAWAGSGLTARVRYLLACATLAIMTIAPILTFLAIDDAGAGAGLAIAQAWRPPSGSIQRALPWVVVIWLCGAIVSSMRLLGAWRFTKVLRTAGVSPAPLEWQAQFQELIRRIGVSRPVRLLVSSIAEVPMVIGWLRPVVLMPVGALAGLPLDQVEALLAHELAHIWRNDYLVNMLQSIAEAMLFYHPAVWWVSEQIRVERELCCDDVAVSVSGDVLVYVRALTDLETRRRARLNTALAADGGSYSSGSLVRRVRRLIAEPRPVARNLPAAGAAWILSVVWLAAIGAATVHGATGPAKPTMLAAPPITPPASLPPAQAPLVKALLFDPFFGPQQTAAAPPAAAIREAPRGAGGMRARSVDLVYLAEPKEPPEEHVDFSGAGWILPPKMVFPQIYESSLNSGDPVSINATGTRGLFSTTCPIACAEFETWVEGLPGDYVESVSTELSTVARESGETTLQRFVGDDKRHVYVTYKAMLEPLAEMGTYRVTIGDCEPRPSNSKLISPANCPVPQIVRDGGTLALELYSDGATGQRLVDYIHIGQHKPILLRTETAHDAYANDAAFSIAHPRLSVNGVGQESLAGTIQGPVLWIYVPGHGRTLLSFRPHADLGFDDSGEVSGNTLTFTVGRNVFRIDGAERIASIGSGAYRVYTLQDSAWEPADPADRGHFMIGAAPAIETAGGPNSKGDSTYMRAMAMSSGLLAFAMNAAFGQAPTKLEFEVASVRLATTPPPGTVRGMRGGPGSPDPEQFTATNAILRNLLLNAYGLSNDQISGPSWMDTEQYTIVAKVPPEATREQFEVMLQNLLAERLHVTAHLVKKDFDAYELTVAKGGIKMKESVIDPKVGPNPPPIDMDAAFQAAFTPLTFKEGFPVLAPGSRPSLHGINVNGRELITARQQAMEGIATRTLQNALGPGTRVVDKTGLTGKYDFHLQYARPNNNAAAAAQTLPTGSDYLDSIGEPAPDVVTAAREQLGLTLTKGKVSMDVLVIDHADKVPAGN